jgi:hypothetical protein
MSRMACASMNNGASVLPGGQEMPMMQKGSMISEEQW